MDFYTSPFFWALLSMLGFQGAILVVGGQRIGRSGSFVFLVLTLVTAGRALLVLPFCTQPRFDPESWHRVGGGLILLAALAIAVPTLSVKWWRPAVAGMKLHTAGIYSLVRHPMYLSEILWPIGWSLLWGSIYGLALTPLWWFSFLLHSLAEEDRLQNVLGPEYASYKERVRGRFFPGVPV